MESGDGEVGGTTGVGEGGGGAGGGDEGDKAAAVEKAEKAAAVKRGKQKMVQAVGTSTPSSSRDVPAVDPRLPSFDLLYTELVVSTNEAILADDCTFQEKNGHDKLVLHIKATHLHIKADKDVSLANQYFWCRSRAEAFPATEQMLTNIDRGGSGFSSDMPLGSRLVCFIGDISRVKACARGVTDSPEEAALEANSRSPGVLRSTPMTQSGLDRAKDIRNTTIIAQEGKEDQILYFITGIRIVPIASDSDWPVSEHERSFHVPPSFVPCLTDG